MLILLHVDVLLWIESALLEVVKLHEVVLALFKHDFSQLSVVDFVRVKGENDLHHELSSLFSWVDQVVDV
jgi:hypothetical protein